MKKETQKSDCLFIGIPYGLAVYAIILFILEAIK